MKCQWWAYSILSQINRVNINKNSNVYENHIQRMADDHYLVIALFKLYEWLNELNKYVEETQEYIDKLNKLSDIKLLRNMFEHEIEYYKNNGHKQKSFYDLSLNQSLLNSVFINNEYYVCGKINIKELKKIIEDVKKWLMMQIFH